MKNVYLSVLIIVFYSFAFGNCLLAQTNRDAEDKNELALERLRLLSEVSGEKLQSSLSNHSWSIGSRYEKREDVSTNIQLCLTSMQFVEELFYEQRILISLFVESSPVSCKNRRTLYNLLKYRTNVVKASIKECHDTISLISPKISNEQVRQLAEESKVTITSILSEFDKYQKEIETLDQSLYDPSSNSDDKLPEDIVINVSKIDRSLFKISAKIKPYFRKGNPVGLVLDEIQHDSIFTNMHLKNGDIILSLNGNSVTTDSGLIDFYGALETAETMSLEIERNNSSQTVHYSFK